MLTYVSLRLFDSESNMLHHLGFTTGYDVSGSTWAWELPHKNKNCQASPLSEAIARFTRTEIQSPIKTVRWTIGASLHLENGPEKQLKSLQLSARLGCVHVVQNHLTSLCNNIMTTFSSYKQVLNFKKGLTYPSVTTPNLYFVPSSRSASHCSNFERTSGKGSALSTISLQI